MPNNIWPELILEEWQDTLATVHMWLQIVGKIRMKQTPLVNHWWNVTLYVSARGLTTSPMPYEDRIFEINLCPKPGYELINGNAEVRNDLKLLLCWRAEVHVILMWTEITLLHQFGNGDFRVNWAAEFLVPLPFKGGNVVRRCSS